MHDRPLTVSYRVALCSGGVYRATPPGKVNAMNLVDMDLEEGTNEQ